MQSWHDSKAYLRFASLPFVSTIENRLEITGQIDGRAFNVHECVCVCVCVFRVNSQFNNKNEKLNVLQTHSYDYGGPMARVWRERIESRWAVQPRQLASFVPRTKLITFD